MYGPYSYVGSTLDPNILTTETDVRFWVATGYNIGEPLTTSAHDRKMGRIWQDIDVIVRSHAQAGTLVLTYADPAFKELLDEAITTWKAFRLQGTPWRQAPVDGPSSVNAGDRSLEGRLHYLLHKAAERQGTLLGYGVKYWLWK